MLPFTDLPVQTAPDELDRWAALMTKKETRPGRRSDVIYRAMARAIAPEFHRWAADPKFSVEDVQTLLTTIFARGEDDGYALARELERQGWTGDAALVEILDRAGGERHHAHDRLVKGWVKAHAVTLDLPVGTKVATKDGDGEIVRHEPESATYVVCIPSLGHVREGMGTHGQLLTQEELKAA